MATHNPHLAAAQVVHDAGGELVGRTRLQKVAYLTQLAGFGDVFSFEYRHYGPYSEDLARGMSIASALGQVREDIKSTEWGGRYSVYSSGAFPDAKNDGLRSAFVQCAKAINAIDLELAATAAFLFVVEGASDPWTETARRKPEKADGGRLKNAMDAYERLRQISAPRALPELPHG